MRPPSVCGLLGMITSDGTAASDAELIASAAHCMRHRGPDEPGTWNDDDVVFGFNRLSIIDIEHSHQPLRWGPTENPERYALVFNGEIYNYLEIREELAAEFGTQFRTEGDGESIVAGFHHWGPDVVRKLRGMFAFSIWDTEKREMFLARDQFGIKPMFLATSDRGTAFGSEKKSLLEILERLELDKELDDRAIEHYTVLQYVPEPETLHRSITRLESGCYATLRPGVAPEVTRYFVPKFPVRPFAVGGEQKRYDEIADVLRDSVAKHMRADVTVGSFLSGGIDSTAIAALAIQHNPDLITFTTGFERDGYSEVDVAAESAEAIGARHIVKVVSPREFVDALPKIIWYLDDPVADPALVPLYFVAAEARKHVKVVLSGEGADELFGGYTIYKEPLSLKSFDKLSPGLRRLAGKISDRIPEGTRGKSLLHRGSLSLEERYYGNARSFDDARLRSTLRNFRPDWTHQDVTAPIYEMSEGMDPVTRMQHLDLFTWLRGDILVKADKINMAHSLELRVPFLDKEVFAVAEQLPFEEKISHDTTKYALRKALEQIVPPHVLHRRKLGFPVPLRHWLAGTEMYDWARELISTSDTDHIFDKAFVIQMLEEHRRGDVDNSRRIWTVLCFMLWYGIFVDGTVDPQIEDHDYPVRL